ncbi:HAD family hydrolase [Clostridium butyricum]|uniref:HAD family hydrolase n=1 Tax=Clostridium butyricum TaxID=1492 RepID=UPI00374E6797
MLKAVIFDLDDTLYNYDEINKIAMQELCTYTCNTLNVDEDLFNKAFEYGRNSTKEGLENFASGHNRMIYYQKTLEFLGVNPIMYALEMYEVYWNSMLENMILNEGVMELLQFLKKKNIRIAICTDLTTHIQHRKIRKLNIEQYIDCIVTSEEAGEEKPGLKIFDLCLKKLNIVKGEAFYVGDSFKKDIIGANNAGLFPIWYNQLKRKNIEVAFEYKEITNMIQIKDLLKG